MTLDATVADQPLRGASVGQAYLRFWQRIVLFSGRASISEYWWPVLVNTLALIAGAIVVGVLLAIGSAIGSPGDAVTNALAAVLVVVLALGTVALTLASISVAVRRLHDADLSGWLVLLGLIPSVGGIITLVLSLLPASPRGARFDHGAPPAAPLVPAALPAPRDADGVPAFDAWPAPAAATPATAPVPTTTVHGDAPTAGSALRDAWSSIGAVRPVEPPLAAPPGTRNQGYVLVTRSAGAPLLATDGLHAAEGVAALGPGAELYLAEPEQLDEPGASWRFALLAAVARRVRASGLHLPAELEQYGTLSMAVQGVDAPEGWEGEDGATGVLLGLPVQDVPQAVATGAGEVALVAVTPLRPAELQEILAGGAAARARVAGRLASTPEHLLATRD